VPLKFCKTALLNLKSPAETLLVAIPSTSVPTSRWPRKSSTHPSESLDGGAAWSANQNRWAAQNSIPPNNNSNSSNRNTNIYWLCLLRRNSQDSWSSLWNIERWCLTLEANFWTTNYQLTPANNKSTQR